MASAQTLISTYVVDQPVGPLSFPIDTQDGAEQETGSAAGQEEVVLQHLPLVKAIATRLHESLPVHVDVDDLVHAGILGLIDAASKYKSDKNVAFSTYAKHRIKGAILDSLRQQDWASRDVRRRQKQVQMATEELSAELERTPTDGEVADRLGVSMPRWRTIMLDLQVCGVVSADTRSEGTGETDLPPAEFAGSSNVHPDTLCARGQMRDLLRRAVQSLPQRYQQVVDLYYSDEMTMREIGNILGINESRVSQIHKAALEKMEALLLEAGVRSSAAF